MAEFSHQPAFDITTLIGKTPAEAAILTGMLIRETIRNGTVQICTRDHREDRINVATDAGYIKSVSGIG